MWGDREGSTCLLGHMHRRFAPAILRQPRAQSSVQTHERGLGCLCTCPFTGDKAPWAWTKHYFIQLVSSPYQETELALSAHA